jgi:regulator of sigma E protease
MELLQGLVTLVLFIAILGGLVLVHEIGHFVTARLAGVRVLEFGIGFPPRAKVLRAKGETLYTLNWLPIGGFVKLEGEDGDEPDDPRSFVRARLPTKLVILLAGVFMNLVTALVIFTVIAWVATPLVGARIETNPDPGSPAAAAGLRAGDGIRTVDGQSFEFYGQSIVEVLRTKAGQTVTLDVDRSDGTREPVSVTLRSPEEISEQVGPLGIGVPTAYFYDQYTGHDLGTAIGIGVDETSRWFGLILAGLGDLVGGFVSNPTAPPPVAGPVGIATQIGDIFWGSGPILTLYVAAILSANLALVNALPFPPLDGGRMLMIVLKSLFGARISLRAERLTYFVGFVFLFAFLIWVTGFDIVRIFGGDS